MSIFKISCLLLSILFSINGIAQIDAVAKQKIDSLFQAYENEPGVATAIYSKGKVIYQKTIGYANMDHDIKVTPKTVFEMGSLSMHFTAACIVILEGKDKLDLDDPIHQYLPELPQYAEGQPTIRHLLHHTSGLRDYVNVLDMTKGTFDVHYDKDQGLDFLIQQKVLGFEPGQEYEYSNSNYLLLNHIVSRISGQSLGVFAQKEIFEPLGMTNTFFYEEFGKIVKNRAVGYNKEGAAANFHQAHYFNFISAGDGRLQTTLEDFVKWIQNFDDSKIGPSNFIGELLKKGIENDGDVMSYALGLEHGERAGFNSFGHNGYWGHTRSFFMKFPKLDLSIVVISNNATVNSTRKAFQIADILLADKYPKEIVNPLESVPTIAVSPAQLEKWTGDYITYKTGYLRKLLIKNDTLICQIAENNEQKLIPIGKDEFRVLGSPVSTIQFKKNEQGQKVLQYIRSGYNRYEFTSYQPSTISDSYLQALTGKYYAESIKVAFDLSIRDNLLVASINGKEYASYYHVTAHLFCSKPYYLGYLVFEEDNEGEPIFTFNDYSMQKVKFVKKEE